MPDNIEEEFEAWLLIDKTLAKSTTYQKMRYLDFAQRQGFDLNRFINDGPDAATKEGRKFLLWVKRDNDGNGYNNYVKLLKNLAEYAGYPQHKVNFELQPQTRPKPRTYGENELNKLLAWRHPSNHKRSLRNRALFRWGLISGLRPSEVQRMDLLDLDPVDSSFEVTNPAKRGYQRTVPVEETRIWSPTHPIGAWLRNHPLIPNPKEGEDMTAEERREALGHVLDKVPTTPMWVSLHEGHGRLSLGAVRMELYRMGKQAGVTCNFTRCRHTRATQLLQRGLDIRYIQFLLGHIEINSTTVYAEADTDDVRSALQSIDLPGNNPNESGGF